MLNIAICDDNILIVEHMKKMLTDILEEEYKIYEYTNPHEFEKQFEEKIGEELDILIIDIVFFDITGIDIVKRIQNKNKKVKIIYISGHMEYVEKIFETNPKYFLIKPITKEKLEKAINKSINEIGDNSKIKEIILGNDKKMIKILLKEVLYFESNKRIIIIHNTYNKSKIYMKLSELEEKLPENFIRCHQSYIINLRNVDRIQNNRFIMQNRRYNQY